MPNFTDAQLQELIVHEVGNPSREEPLVLSAEPMAQFSEEEQSALTAYLLAGFGKNSDEFAFRHAVSLERNPAYRACQRLFAQTTLTEQSQALAQRLYECSARPNIKSGHLLVARIEGIRYQDQAVSGLVIIKAELSDLFIHLRRAGETIQTQLMNGIGTQRIDKGCLVLDTKAAAGYRVWVAGYRPTERQYWVNEFLNLTALATPQESSKRFIQTVGDFCQSEVMAEMDPVARMELGARALRYLDGTEEFAQDEFEREVFQGHEALGERFRAYRDECYAGTGYELPERFQVDKQVLNRRKRRLMRSMVLDDQVEIKVVSDERQDMDGRMEKGFDETRGLNYYKFYYRQER